MLVRKCGDELVETEREVDVLILLDELFSSRRALEEQFFISADTLFGQKDWSDERRAILARCSLGNRLILKRSNCAR